MKRPKNGPNDRRSVSIPLVRGSARRAAVVMSRWAVVRRALWCLCLGYFASELVDGSVEDGLLVVVLIAALFVCLPHSVLREVPRRLLALWVCASLMIAAFVDLPLAKQTSLEFWAAAVALLAPVVLLGLAAEGRACDGGPPSGDSA